MQQPWGKSRMLQQRQGVQSEEISSPSPPLRYPDVRYALNLNEIGTRWADLVEHRDGSWG
jgi:hypothetical protein